MGLFNKLIEKFNKNNNIDNNFQEVEVNNKEKVYEYDERDRKVLSESRAYIKKNEEYKQGKLHLSETEMDRIAEGISAYLYSSGISVSNFNDNKKSTATNSSGNDNFAMNTSCSNNGYNGVTSKRFGERDYWYNHSSNPATASNLSNPSKSTDEWFDKKFGSVRNHMKDDASNEFNSYMDKQRDLLDKW